MDEDDHTYVEIWLTKRQCELVMQMLRDVIGLLSYSSQNKLDKELSEIYDELRISIGERD